MIEPPPPAGPLRSVRIGSATWRLRGGWPLDSILPILADADGVLADAASLLKNGRSTTVGRRGGFVIKRYNAAGFRRRLKDFFRPSRAHRAFFRACRLESAGIRTARAVGFASRGWRGFSRRSYLVFEEIPGARNISDRECARRPEIERLAALIAGLHRGGFFHRDLKAANILFDGAGMPHLLDMEGVGFRKNLRRSRRILDLRRLARAARSLPWISRADKLRFLKAYCREAGLTDWRDWPARLESL